MLPEQPTPLLKQPVAVVGMACRLPGVNGLDEYWQLLAGGRSSIGELPAERLDRELYYSPTKGTRGKTYSTLGGLLSPCSSGDSFPALPERLQRDYDACHQILCQVAAAACRDAGFAPTELSGANTGIYIGHSGGSTLPAEMTYATLAEETADLLRDCDNFHQLPPGEQAAVLAEMVNRMRHGRPTRRPGGAPFVEANSAAAIIAELLEIAGPQMVIDAACASSLVALAIAAMALGSGEIDAAIVGGASFNKSDSLILFSHAQSCSATGSRPFDAEADGLISSEGYVVLVLKTLERAMADGDRVRGVVRGLGFSSDGRGRSLWAPRKEGQLEAIRRAYAGGIDPANIQFIEAHATSTKVGDATEIEALTGFFAQQLAPGNRIPLGSVKSNIGHTLETAGLASVAKVLLAMQHGLLPPTVNVTRLSPAVRWGEIPFFVPTTSAPWPVQPQTHSRWAAVNAFGIGGLNVHVVIEGPEALDGSPSVPVPAARNGSRNGHRDESRAIAIIGRGVVLPGALKLSEFESLVVKGRTSLTTAPPERWRPAMGIECRASRPRRAPTNVGGFVHGFEYDWKRHRIPPKQIAEANPLQFMLLDAAEQALCESGYDRRAWDRAAAAVVVGTIFGGDFCNQLQVGLRLPEFERTLEQLLAERGVAAAQAKAIVAEYRERFLKLKPALLDETGSFTSSTLASRVAKSLDLMGGALALDAGDASSLAALAVACDLLRSRACSMVFCAGAERAMDLQSFEALHLAGRLADPSVPGGDGYLPGEGVAMLLLKRLADARADGDRVLGVISGVGAAADTRDIARATQLAANRLLRHLPADSVPTIAEAGCGVARIDEAERSGLAAAGICPSARAEDATRLIHQIGHTRGAHGMAAIVKATLDERSKTHREPGAPACPPLAVVSNTTRSGLVYEALIDPAPMAGPRTREQQPIRSAQTSASSTHRILRFTGRDDTEVAGRLQQAIADPRLSQDDNVTFSDGDRVRMAIVAPDEPAAVEARLRLAAGSWQRPEARIPLQEQGVFTWRPGASRPQVAFLFPGQGSQYPGMLKSLVAVSPAAARLIAEADELLACRRLEPFDRMAWDSNGRSGADIWTTQAVMLLADLAVLAALGERGLAPDWVAGHSYGEFPAMVAAGVWTLEQALDATRVRAEAIRTSRGAAGRMLSVHAAAAEVEAIARGCGLEIFITHVNAPTQTVVGASQETISRLAALLGAHGLDFRLLDVPGAFHTPLMADAQRALRQALTGIPLQPPRVRLLSNITNRPTSDPGELRCNLVAQLVEPVRYCELVEKLVAEGVRVLVEVGPNQVLARLNRQILTRDDVLLVAADHPARDAGEQLTRVSAAFECAGVSPSVAASQSPAFVRPVKPRLLSFDATALRRQRMRSVAMSQPAGSTTAPSREPVQSVAAVVAPASVAPVRQPVAACSNNGELEGFLINFVVEQTGYPPEVVALDADLEADLGIDSIKKAQLLGELGEYFDAAADARNNDFAQLRTLRQISQAIAAQPGKHHWLPPELAPPADLPAALPATATVLDSTAADALPGGDKLVQHLIRFIVEQTGYPPDVITPDADFEADLGIDSIKKSQMLGELRDQFAFELGEGDSTTIGEIRTLRDLLARLSGPAMIESAIVKPAAVCNVQPLAPAAPAAHVEARPQHDAADGLLRLSGSPYEMGRQRGRRQAAAIRALMRRLLAASRGRRVFEPQWLEQPNGELADGALEELHGLAEGAGVHIGNLIALNGALSLARVAGLAHAAVVQNGRSGNRLLHSIIHPSTEWLPPGIAIEPVLYRPADGHAYLQFGLPGELGGLLGINSRGLIVSARPRGDAAQQSASTLLHALAFKQLLTKADDPHAAVAILRELRRTGRWALCISRLESNRVYTVEYDAKRVTVKHGESVVERDGSTRPRSRARLRTALDCASAAEIFGTLAGALVPELVPLPLAGVAIRPHEQQALIAKFAEGGTVANEPVAVDLGELMQPAELRQSSMSVDALPAGSGTTNEISPPAGESVTSRFVLRMQKRSRRRGDDSRPEWSGTAVIVGDNAAAKLLATRLKRAGVRAERLPGDDPVAAVAELERIWASGPAPHLFLLSPRDQEAAADPHLANWHERRRRGVLLPFVVCQRWVKLVLDAGLADSASLVTLTSLGGDFGLSGNLQSLESGALAGLLKAICIELWVQGHRWLPIKIIDAPAAEPPASLVSAIFDELATASYDLELAYRAGQRHVVQAVAEPARRPTHVLRPGGVWVCTGGARGITAYAARELARRYQLRLHLVGTAGHPQLPDRWRNMSVDEMKHCRTLIMDAARAMGRPPLKEWQRFEKALEIDRTLGELRAEGISATYHSCDVGNRAELERVLDEIRRTDGPIEGVLHGAGVGKDARLDRKDLADVEQCLAAKIDGAANLMLLTRGDPLRHFIAFGSISGRFGANGHGDYSLANDMLAKQVDWFRRQRPECASATFHWHAWGDVGMATKPETKLALEMIGMQFMPAREGLAHLVREIEAGLPEGEVLITDDRYYRMFYPADSLVAGNNRAVESIRTPLLERSAASQHGNLAVLLDAATDPFLAEHRLNGQPLLPIAVGVEVLCEAAQARDAAWRVRELRNVEAVHPLRVDPARPQTLHVRSRTLGDGLVACELVGDFCTRDGRLVEADRIYLRGTVKLGRSRSRAEPRRFRIPAGEWQPVEYPRPDAPFYLGSPLQALRRIKEGERLLWGRMIVPSLADLAGRTRRADGWIVPSAALDACLYATGVLAWRQLEPGVALPASFGSIRLGRLPEAGEACMVETRFRRRDGRRAEFDFTLLGADGELLLEVEQYTICWLSGTSAGEQQPALARGSR